MDLAALRIVSGRLDKARENAEPTTALVRERARLEKHVRDRTRHARTGSPTARRAGLAVDELLDRLGDGRLVEIVAINDELHAVVCGSGRIRRVAAGSLSAAASHVERARWMLTSLAYRQSERSASALADVGKLLERELLGPVVGQLGEGLVVLAPPGRLQAVPWGVLPSLAMRVHVAAPSARTWLAAHRAEPPAGNDVVVARGPDLSGAGSESSAIADIHPGSTLLIGAAATAAAVIDALDGSALAHIAAHGDFRSDNALFSSLLMADGPLTAYDIEGLHRAPHRIVLPSCDSGRQQHVGGDEVLGLASVLLSMGSAGLVAPVVPINDAATVPVMIALHRAIATGATMPEALLSARRAAADDPAAAIAAAAFVAFGAA